MLLRRFITTATIQAAVLILIPILSRHFRQGLKAHRVLAATRRLIAVGLAFFACCVVGLVCFVALARFVALAGGTGGQGPREKGRFVVGQLFPALPLAKQ